MTRRKYRPRSVEDAVLKRQDNRCHCGRCERSPLAGHEVQFNHDPPLGLREYDEVTKEYTPAENDPAYLFAEIKAHHLEGTHHPRGKHTTIDSDLHAIRKVRNIRKSGLGTVVKDRPRVSRFQKGRKMQSRPFPKRFVP